MIAHSALCLTELRSAGSKNAFVRLMGEKLGSNTSFHCKIGLEILGCWHRQETEHSLGA
jgi:hypothetical protein